MSKAQAARRFRRFHKREPRAGELGTVSASATPTLLVGKLVGVIYETPGDENGKGLTTYIHRFTKNRRPSLFVSADGAQLFVVGGATRFTERGFVE